MNSALQVSPAESTAFTISTGRGWLRESRGRFWHFLREEEL